MLPILLISDLNGRCIGITCLNWAFRNQISSTQLAKNPIRSATKKISSFFFNFVDQKSFISTGQSSQPFLLILDLNESYRSNLRALMNKISRTIGVSSNSFCRPLKYSRLYRFEFLTDLVHFSLKWKAYRSELMSCLNKKSWTPPR